MIKLVVNDVDGTLITSSTISNKNMQAIRSLEKAGIGFALASGRDLQGIHQLTDTYGISCEAILGNGAQYVDCDGKVLLSCYLPKDRVEGILQLLEERTIPYMIFTTQGFYTCYQPEFVRDAYIERGILRFHARREMFDETYPCNQLVQIHDLPAFLNQDLQIIKIEAFSLNVQSIQEVKEKLLGWSDIACLSSFNDNIEVTHHDAQKGLILEKVMEQKGLTHDEIAVIGDGLNDLTMFERFPYSYAMGNADALIKKHAYRIVSSNDQDGFADAIEDILTLNRGWSNATEDH